MKIMKIVDAEGHTYLMEGHSREEAVETFGADIDIDLLYAVPHEPTNGVSRILAERASQITRGYTVAGDAQYENDQLLAAGLAYAQAAFTLAQGNYNPNENFCNGQCVWSPFWPWADEHWKPGEDPERCVEKAGALLAAWLDQS